MLRSVPMVDSVRSDTGGGESEGDGGEPPDASDQNEVLFAMRFGLAGHVEWA